MKHIFLIGNKPKELYKGKDYSDLIDNLGPDDVVYRVNRMQSIEYGLSGKRTDCVFCDKYAFHWHDNYVQWVKSVNPNMNMIIPYHSEREYNDNFGSDKNISITVLGNSEESYYIENIKDVLPQITFLFPNYYPTNVVYALNYILNKYKGIEHDITLIGIDAHDRLHTYKAPALRPFVHRGFLPYEDKWLRDLEEAGTIRVLD